MTDEIFFWQVFFLLWGSLIRPILDESSSYEATALFFEEIE